MIHEERTVLVTVKAYPNPSSKYFVGNTNRFRDTFLVLGTFYPPLQLSKEIQQARARFKKGNYLQWSFVKKAA